MGAAIGLLSLLITVAIILWAMVGSGYVGTVAKQNKVARQQVNVMAGKDPTGTVNAIETIHTRVDRTSGRPKLIASEVQAGGVIEDRYGIKAGDRIVEIGGLDFDSNIGSKDAADEWIATAYARQQPIVVVRGSEKLSLPTPQHVAMMAERVRRQAIAEANAAAAAGAAAAAPTPPKPEDTSSLTKALDKIRAGAQ